MTRRRIEYLAVGLILLAIVAVMYPKSPLYLKSVFAQDDRMHDGETATHWIKTLKASDSDSKVQALRALAAIGSDASESVPMITSILVEDNDKIVRSEAALTLSRMGPATKSAVPALAQALEDQEHWVRMNAAFALLRLRQDAKPAVPALIKALRDDSNRTNLGSFPHSIQVVVARSLGWASSGTTDGVAVLTDALHSTAREGSAWGVGLPWAAALALGDIGPAAKPAVPALRALLTTNDKEVREDVKQALEKIEGTVPAAANPS